MTKEMKLMELAEMVNNMKVGEVIDFAPGTAEEVEVFGGWIGVKRIDEYDMDNPMYVVSHCGGQAKAWLYRINEYDQQNWINCCAKMLSHYFENWGEGRVPETITVDVELG